ncbi:MAG: hypothetical protein KKA65_05320 [Nanoarchaeota archaeon]|nr:hypothetical protein [Nanoarchaeota archaeon]MBU4242556.1 hypothetical protein [Nanoarchaeota archaeon]MBU4352539.1 hypothetical protein [Nanoarchaeota archaeon]MBU4456892.1 hypothetical protein [Nanoarchaeota archaeon]
MKGSIITITGSDGSGKETQTKLVVNKALAEGYAIKTLSFPQYEEFWGKRVKEYLSGQYGTLKEIDPKHASQLFALDRFDAKPKIENWLNNGYNIIFDRYLESNFAHQGAKLKGEKRIEMINWLYDFEIKKLGLPESNLIVYLDLPVEFGLKAIEERNKEKKEQGKKDLHEENINHLIATQETYNYLIENNENWKKINCLNENNERLSREELSEVIWTIVKPYLQK